MNAGLFRYPVRIIYVERVKNDYGEVTYKEIGEYRTRACIKHNGGSKYESGNSEVVVPYGKTFQIRNYVKVHEDDFVEYQDKRYRINSISEDTLDWGYKTIMCEIADEDGQEED